MANFNYGNSFNSYEGENVGVERISVWKSVREFFPGGAVLTPSDYQILPGPTGTWKAGDIVPAGTPIGVRNPGGKANFSTNPSDVIGLTYEDVQLGTDGCTFTIVTMGEFLESRYQPNTEKYQNEIPQNIKDHLFGRISFIKEL